MNDEQKDQFRQYVAYPWDMYKDLTSKAVMFIEPKETKMSSINYKEKNMNYTNKFTTQVEGIAAVRSRKFVIASISSDGELSVAANPVLHNAWALAKAECARLAKLNPGKAFVYMQFSGGELAPTMCTSF